MIYLCAVSASILTPRLSLYFSIMKLLNIYWIEWTYTFERSCPIQHHSIMVPKITNNLKGTRKCAEYWMLTESFFKGELYLLRNISNSSMMVYFSKHQPILFFQQLGLPWSLLRALPAVSRGVLPGFALNVWKANELFWIAWCQYFLEKHNIKVLNFVCFIVVFKN